MTGDPVLNAMADELRGALIRAGLDPANPPTEFKPPAARAHEEYIKRGGKVYMDPDSMVDALIRRVVSKST